MNIDEHGMGDVMYHIVFVIQLCVLEMFWASTMWHVAACFGNEDLISEFWNGTISWHVGRFTSSNCSHRPSHLWRAGTCEYWFHVCTSFREIVETRHLVAVGKMGQGRPRKRWNLYFDITNALATFFWRSCRCRCGVVETLLDFCARETSNLDLQRYASPGWFVGMFLGFPGSNGTLLEDARMRIYYNHNSIIIPYTCNISGWL